MSGEDTACAGKTGIEASASWPSPVEGADTQVCPYSLRGSRLRGNDEKSLIATEGLQDSGCDSADGSANGVLTNIATEGLQDSGCDSADGSANGVPTNLEAAQREQAGS